MTTLPTDIRKAAIALVISLIATLTAVYFDGLAYEGLGFSDPLIVGANVIWALFIAWIVRDLFKGKGIKLTLILVGLIMITFLVWDVLDFGFSIAQVFYAIEILMFAAAYYFVTTPQSKAWFASKLSD